MDDFYEGWGADYEAGWNMTEEEWEEMHTPYKESDDWHFPDE